jgi:hypothetical protein
VDIRLGVDSRCELIAKDGEALLVRSQTLDKGIELCGGKSFERRHVYSMCSVGRLFRSNVI